MFVNCSLSGKSTRRRRVRRNLSHAADTAAASVSEQVSACSSASSASANTQSQHRVEDNTETKRCRVRNVQLIKTKHQSSETSMETVTIRALTEGDCERTVSDNSCKLGKCSTDRTAVVKNSGSVSVVGQFTDAAVSACAAAACVVVLEPITCVGGQRVARNMTSVDSHNEQVGAISRGKRRKCQAADDDVEPDDAALTSSSSTASCKYCR